MIRSEVRWLCAALCLAMCSCQSPLPNRFATANRSLPHAATRTPAVADAPAVDRTITDRSIRDRAVVQASAQEPIATPLNPMPLAAAPREPAPPIVGPWKPPGIAAPWPGDEYIREGGIVGPMPQVNAEGAIAGLNVEDTVAHFDTVDGRTLVEPSNRVFIYSPRFSAVRHVVSVIENEQAQRSIGVHQPRPVSQADDLTLVASNRQNLQPMREISANLASQYQSQQGTGALSSRIGPQGFDNRFKAYENLAAIRSGVFETAEMANLAEGVQAALAWSNPQAVQVVLDRRAAMVDNAYVGVEATYTVDQPPPNPKLRVVKIASTNMAKPGEKIEFTIRYDNVGNQPIGNVTLVDNLSGRLEYVPDTAQSTLPAEFSAKPSESGSQVLRWEIGPALEAGKGGVVRFTCRVR